MSPCPLEMYRKGFSNIFCLGAFAPKNLKIEGVKQAPSPERHLTQTSLYRPEYALYREKSTIDIANR